MAPEESTRTNCAPPHHSLTSNAGAREGSELIRAVLAIVTCFVSTASIAQIRVVDGDTLEVGGTKYRLNGIDAPEHGQKCGDWSCGSDATDALVEIVKGRTVTCEAITEDGYGRVIATCYADGNDIGGTMIDKGLAWAFLRYSDAYASEETAAKAREIGIWSSHFTPPWEFRDARWAAARETAPEGCPIKGNISRNGRIYHAPWSPWYDRTRISTSKGERWFCSEAEAIAAGWRAPYWE